MVFWVSFLRRCGCAASELMGVVSGWGMELRAVTGTGGKGWLSCLNRNGRDFEWDSWDSGLEMLLDFGAARFEFRRVANGRGRRLG